MLVEIGTVFMCYIVCFENPLLYTGPQKETLALSCFLCFTRPVANKAMAEQAAKLPVSQVIVCFPY